MTLRPVTVLVSASGAPGTAALLRGCARTASASSAWSARTCPSARSDAHLCDAFHLVPAGADPGFADAVLDVVPSGSASTSSSRRARSTWRAWRRTASASPCRCSSPARMRSIARTTRRRRYALLHRLGLPAPAFRRVNGAAEVDAAARELGYPERAVCFKPVFSSGSRGFSVLDPTVDRAHQLLNERPGAGRDAARGGRGARFRRRRARPARHGAGDRRRAHDRRDRRRRRVVLGHPKTREAMRAGLAMYFVTLEDPGLDGDRRRDRRRARDRMVLQHPARRGVRHRDQPADLDRRLPGGPQSPLPRGQASARAKSRTTSCAALRARIRPAGRPFATSTSSSGTPAREPSRRVGTTARAVRAAVASRQLLPPNDDRRKSHARRRSPLGG